MASVRVEETEQFYNITCDVILPTKKSLETDQPLDLTMVSQEVYETVEH